MRFRELIDGEFPEKYRKIYMERAKKELARADEFVKVKIEKREYAWSGQADYEIYFSWNIKNNFFSYYELLSPEEKEELKQLARKALKKIDAEFDALESQFTPDKSFEVHIDWSLLFAATHADFKHRFVEWIKDSVSKRYHYLNSREYLKKINSLNGHEQTKAIRKHGDDVKQTLELLKHLKSFADINESVGSNRFIVTDIFFAKPADEGGSRIMDFKEVLEVTRRNNVLTWFKVVESLYVDAGKKPKSDLVYEADTQSFDACTLPEREFHMRFLNSLKDSEN